MRILLVILQFPPDVNSNGQLMAQLASNLVGRGHHVSVITTFPHYAEFRTWPEYRGKLAERSVYQGMPVQRVRIYARGSKQKMLHRSLSYVSFGIAATLIGLMSRSRYDVILCPNGGFLTGVAASIVGQVKRVPVVLNIQDLYPETPIRTGQIKNRYAIGLLRTFERYMYRRAARITVITPHFREYIVNTGIPVEAVSVIPNFVDTAFIRSLPKDNDFARRHGFLQKFVITHAGNLGYVYDLETMVDAAALLRDRPEIVFLIVGDGVLKARLQAKVRDLGLDNVRFLPYQPREALPSMRAASDVQVALNRPGASAHSMPSKIYEIMASGRPLLASADRSSDLWQLVEEANCGLVVPPDNAPALAAAVLQLYHDEAGRARMGQRGRAWAEKHYSLDAVTERYAELLNNVTAHGSPTAPPQPVRPAVGVG